MELSKLYLGPVSKNVVDAAIEYSNEHQISLGLIASRRQIDFNSGYVNKEWGTQNFAEYVKDRSKFIWLCRDHGGYNQGEIEGKDYGFDSFYEDAKYLDLIHIDPWRCGNFVNSLDKTIEYIKFCYECNDEIKFEIGTEESIYNYTVDDFEQLIEFCKFDLKEKQFKNIIYAVIQSGTSLKDGYNTGNYSKEKLEKMLKVCQKYGLKSKEHNGDYLSSTLIKEKFNLGLDAINIAPELGQIESEVILNLIKENKRNDLLELFLDLCYQSGKYKKWLSKSTFQYSNEDIIKISGHYVFSWPEFKEIKKTFPEIDQLTKTKIKERIKNIIS